MTGTTKDEVLLEKARSGDQNAFGLLYERHRNRIFSFLIRLLGSHEIAESITHDCFMSLVVRASEESWSPMPASLRTRLYSCARALAMRHLDDSSQGSKAAPEDHWISTGAMRNKREKESLVSEVGEAVASLPPLEREALILAEYEGLELDEIAQVVNADVGVVNVRLRAARQRLRKLLANHL